MKIILSTDEMPKKQEGIRSHPLIVRSPTDSFESNDDIAEEKAVAMVYNGISHAVMMATPLNLEDFALGFSLTEGIIHQKNHCYGIEIVGSELGYECQIKVPNANFAALKQRRRQLSGRTGCGICGLESLEAVVPDLASIRQSQGFLSVSDGGEKNSQGERNTFPSINRLPNTLLPSFDVVEKALRQLQEQQQLQAKCGAVHAAGFSDQEGRVTLLREDVGRHNALDKLLGALATNNQKRVDGFIVISSRASYEMVYKTAISGIKTLVAVSAPTAMAIELAVQFNMNLIGFVREGRQLIYCQSH